MYHSISVINLGEKKKLILSEKRIKILIFETSSYKKQHF